MGFGAKKPIPYPYSCLVQKPDPTVEGYEAYRNVGRKYTLITRGADGGFVLGRAIDLAEGSVFIKRGTYLAQNVAMRPQVPLVGEGIDRTILRLAPAATERLLRFTPVADMTREVYQISNLTLDGNRTNQTSTLPLFDGTGDALTHGQQHQKTLVAENIKVIDGLGTGFRVANIGGWSTLKNIYAINCGSASGHYGVEAITSVCIDVFKMFCYGNRSGAFLTLAWGSGYSVCCDYNQYDGLNISARAMYGCVGTESSVAGAGLGSNIIIRLIAEGAWGCRASASAPRSPRASLLVLGTTYWYGGLIGAPAGATLILDRDAADTYDAGNLIIRDAVSHIISNATVTNPFLAKTNFELVYAINAWNGNEATPRANVWYQIQCPIYVTSTGGTGVSIAIRDAGYTDVWSGLTTLDRQYLPARWWINWGAFTEAPTVTIRFV